MADLRGVQMLAKADVMQLRLSGMILAALVERRILSQEEARAIVEDVASKVPPELDAYRLALVELQNEFR